ncbi:hypothetical protein [Moritella sp. F3]|uniref:hypothetical protein n=1 Tax=Moritella sp. F3 TaxID=2718882 RepID=UPI0018E0EA26|nr:hypothetical protein [Moritella sp. F3]GIC77668.1 hypothetical protein FMO001_23950 [Moritella sp. F1]GIC82081.1 hypothetical protein FMO003_23620 [Moritella sp. F3]
MAKNSYATEVLNRELNKLEKSLTGVISKCKACPASEFLELMEEVRVKLNCCSDRTNPEFVEWMIEAGKKEKRLKKEMTPGSSEKHWDRRHKIETQIIEINSAISRLNYY